MDNAIMQGYTIAWASDVSEAGFSRSGIAIVPDENAPENAGSDQERWLGQSSRERDASIRARVGSEVLAEKKITQEMRQIAYDNYQTTDDHGMQIYGIANDQNGNKFYMVKIHGVKPDLMMDYGMHPKHLLSIKHLVLCFIRMQFLLLLQKTWPLMI